MTTFNLIALLITSLIVVILLFFGVVWKLLDDVKEWQKSQYKKLDFINTQIAGIWRGQDKMENNTAILSSIVDKMHKNLCSKILDEMQVEEIKRKNDVYAECRRMDAINTASVCENMTEIQKELQKKGGQDDNNH